MFTLETPRLVLRDYLFEDWEPIHVYAQDPEFSKYEPWGPNSEEDSRKFVTDMLKLAGEPHRFRFDLAITLKPEKRHIGGCSIRRECQASAVGSLGWSVNPLFQNQGYATEAARGMLEFGFGPLGMKLIYALCDIRNGASARVMEKLGMKRVGEIQGDKLIKGHLRSVYRYEIT